MVNSGAVLGDLNTLKSVGSTYSSEIEGLSEAWKGPSHDNLVSKAEEFISEYISTIASQMNAYATACDLYEQYVVAKRNKEISESNYQKAVAQNDNSSAKEFASNVKQFTNEVKELKTKIEEQLRTASSSKLTATTTNADTISANAITANTTNESKATSSTSNQATAAVSTASGGGSYSGGGSASYSGGGFYSGGGSYSGGTSSYSGGSYTGSGTSSPSSANVETKKVEGSANLNGNVIDTSKPVGTGTKYTLSDSDIQYLAYVAKREQGSVEGAKLELSLMANLYEKNKSKYRNVTDYVKNSGWFGSGSTSNYSYPGDDYVEAAREVLSEGNRYLASDVVEHDCISDITSISTGSRSDRNSYIPGKTVIHNRYGANYVFVGFAPNGGDPFGYLV